MKFFVFAFVLFFSVFFGKAIGDKGLTTSPIGMQSGSIEIELDGQTYTVFLFENTGQVGRFFYTPIFQFQAGGSGELRISEIPLPNGKVRLALFLVNDRKRIVNKLVSEAEKLGQSFLGSDKNEEQKLGRLLSNTVEASFVPIELSRISIVDSSEYYRLNFRTINPGPHYETLRVWLDVDKNEVEGAKRYLLDGGPELLLVYTYLAKSVKSVITEITINRIVDTSVFQKIFGEGSNLRDVYLEGKEVLVTREQKLEMTKKVLEEFNIRVTVEDLSLYEHSKDSSYVELLRLFGGEEPVFRSMDELEKGARLRDYDLVSKNDLAPDKIKKFVYELNEHFQDENRIQRGFEGKVSGSYKLFKAAASANTTRDDFMKKVRDKHLKLEIEGDLIVAKGVSIHRIDTSEFKSNRYLSSQISVVENLFTERDFTLFTTKTVTLKSDTCETCSGTKFTECNICNGFGKVECVKCGGRGLLFEEKEERVLTLVDCGRHLSIDKDAGNIVDQYFHVACKNRMISRNYQHDPNHRRTWNSSCRHCHAPAGTLCYMLKPCPANCFGGKLLRTVTKKVKNVMPCLECRGGYLSCNSDCKFGRKECKECD